MTQQPRDLEPHNNNSGRQFENDADELTHRHLEDANHEISEEDFRNVRVAVTTSQPDSPTEKALEESDEKIADHKADNEDDTTPGEQKSTPWDVIGS